MSDRSFFNNRFIGDKSTQAEVVGRRRVCCKCQLCGEIFTLSGEVTDEDDSFEDAVRTFDDLFYPHHCKDGRIGAGLLVGFSVPVIGIEEDK